MDSEETTFCLNLLEPLGNWLVGAVVADEAGREELEQGVVFVPLHNCHSQPICWPVFASSEIGHEPSIFRNFVGSKSWAKPLNKIAEAASLNINEVDFVLEEMSVVTRWNLSWFLFIFVAKIDLNRVVRSKTGHELVVVLPPCICDCIHVLLSSDRSIISQAGTMVLFDDRVEAVEEGLEERVFSVFDNPGHSSILRLLLGLKETLSDKERLLLLLDIGLFADPDENVIVELQNEDVVGVEVSASERSLLDGRALELSVCV